MESDQAVRPILAAVDFSPDSEAALVCAAEMAAMFAAPLQIVHVVHDPGEAPGYYAVQGREKHIQKLEDVAASMFNDFISRIIKEHPRLAAVESAERILVTGLPVSRILELAAKIQARMIVMGSQGRTGMARALLGSKAEQVVRLAPIPVTIVKSGKNATDVAGR